MDRAISWLQTRAPAVGEPLAVLAGALRILTAEGSVLRETGWIESLRRGKPVDRYGTDVPWMNYQAAALIADHLPREARVFEFGSGGSTAWLAGMAREVVSVETDPTWSSTSARQLPSNAAVHLCPPDDSYPESAITHGGQFDLIFVDGVRRSECLRRSVPALSRRGVLVLDDSERTEYALALEDIRNQGFRELRFKGLKPLAVRWSISCSVLYRDGNCLGL